MMKNGNALLASLCLAICLCGCDTGDPDWDRAVGTGEVAVGKSLQVGGAAAVANCPEPATMAAGAIGAGIGAALEADGIARIARANQRDMESD